ncbi:Inner membrane protein [Salmonella sp. NCTC 11881]|nr:Inner membrane protein [Salmonella sp. NCTC 11881]
MRRKKKKPRHWECCLITSLEEILAFVNAVPFDAIRFILDAARLNGALSQEGLRGSWGLHIGSTLAKQCDRGLLAKDLSTAILIRTSAASDARMGGATLPAMSNSGSGNQGDYRHGASHGGC